MLTAMFNFLKYAPQFQELEHSHDITSNSKSAVVYAFKTLQGAT